MKTQLFIVLSSVIVLAGAGVIAWYLVVSPGGGQAADTVAASAVSRQDELAQTPEPEVESPALLDDNPSTTGDEVVDIAREVAAPAAEEAKSAEIQTGQDPPAPTKSPATKLQTAAQTEPGAIQRPDAQLTVEAQSTAVPVVGAQATDSQPAGVPPAETTAVNSAPVVIRQGQFRDGDEVHKGSGTATISQKPDGSYLLSFDNFAVCCGPDLYVFLASNPSPAGHADLGDYLELSPLQASTGDQTYEISADTDLSKINSIVIYCKPFEVIISTATLG